MSLPSMPSIDSGDIRVLREIPEHEKSPALPLVHASGPVLSGGGGGGGGGGDEAEPPPPQATQNAVKLNKQRILVKAFMLLVPVWRQPGGFVVLRGFSFVVVVA